MKKMMISMMIFLTVLIIPHMRVQAAGRTLPEAYDMMGNRVCFDSAGYTKNAGPILFRFDGMAGDSGDIWVYDDGSTVNPVEDGMYLMGADTGHAEVSFYRYGKDPAEGALEHAGYSADICVETATPPAVSISENEAGYSVRITPAEYCATYCLLRGDKNGAVESIERETELQLSDEGIYELYIYAVDGMGHVAEGTDIPSLIIDRTPPECTLGAVKLDEREAVISMASSDAVSGVKSAVIRHEGKVIYRGAGNEETITLDISGMGYGSTKYDVEVYDNSDNKTKGSFEIKMSDRTPPLLAVDGISDMSIYGRAVTLKADAIDEGKGECRITGKIRRYAADGGYLEEKSLSSNSITLKDSGIYISEICAEDAEGNKSHDRRIFAIDSDAPVIGGLDGLDGSKLESFSLEHPAEAVLDDSLYDVSMMLNGLKYDGEEVRKSGRYRLSVYASDEFGNGTLKDVSFEISGKDGEGRKENDPKDKKDDGGISENAAVKADADAAGKAAGEAVAISGDKGSSAIPLMGYAVNTGENEAETAKTQEGTGHRSGFIERSIYAIIGFIGQIFHT